LLQVSQKLQHDEILLTGGNGFLGKVLLGTLLDRYPEFKQLHVLVRPRADLSASDRFYVETLRSPALVPIVEKIAGKRGKDFLRRKITVWPGDVGRPGLGLEAAALSRLSGRVKLIINCAGLVEFFPPVDESFRSNVDGVEHVISVAKQLPAKLLHVSTCFVCGDTEGLIEESGEILGFYPHRKGPDDSSFHPAEELRYCRERIRQVYDSAGPAGDAEPGSTASRSRELIQRLVALGRQRAKHWGWVNTYTYAKSLGEQLIAAERGLDYAIVRPAIVESALRFPFPGWIEGGRTAAPLVLMALGGMKDWPIRADIPLEVVPVDLVAAAILIAGALLLEGQAERLYQLGTADTNPFELGPLVKLLDTESRRAGPKRQNGTRALSLIDPPRRLRFLSAEESRACCARLQRRINRAEAVLSGVKKMLEATRLPGKRALAEWSTALRTLSLQASFREQTLSQYLPFILHNRCVFECENIRQAYDLLSEEDRKLLPWDPERIDWVDYWINHQVKGIQKWIQPEAAREWAFRI